MRDSSYFYLNKRGKKTEVTAASISAWVCNTVHTAYRLVDNEGVQLYSVKGHDVRAFSATWGCLDNVAVEEVIKLAFWHNQTTFITH